MLREIVLDTETTGTDFRNGDRLIEVGCVELINHVQTGRTYHAYVNPQRAVHPDAFAVHGLSDAFLADKPVFSEIVADLVAFCDGASLVIHNAPFDVGFLNMEYARLGAVAPAPIVLAEVVDTLILARKKHPGAGNSLDMLCNRYGIDRSRRTKHGALLDAQILAEVYVELLGGKQTGFDLSVASPEPSRPVAVVDAEPVERGIRRHRSLLTEGERARHEALRASLGGNAVWADYIGADEQA